jgi:hypothetical protein
VRERSSATTPIAVVEVCDSVTPTDRVKDRSAIPDAREGDLRADAEQITDTAGTWCELAELITLTGNTGEPPAQSAFKKTVARAAIAVCVVAVVALFAWIND